MKFNLATVSNLISRVSQIFFFISLLKEDLPLLSLLLSFSLTIYKFYGHNVSFWNGSHAISLKTQEESFTGHEIIGINSHPYIMSSSMMHQKKEEKRELAITNILNQLGHEWTIKTIKNCHFLQCNHCLYRHFFMRLTKKK